MGVESAGGVDAGRVARGQTDPDAPPPHAVAAIAAVRRLLSGAPEDMRGVLVDLDATPEFARRVYAATRAIGHGETSTYGAVAAAVGEPGAAQAVGRALGANPIPLIIPCHRVLAAGGALHGFSAPGGIATKRRLLTLEGALAPTLF